MVVCFVLFCLEFDIYMYGIGWMSMYSYVGWVGGFVTNCLLSQMGREIGFYGTQGRL